MIDASYDTTATLNNTTILDEYKKVGINLVMPDRKEKVVDRIIKTRNNLYRLRVGSNCDDFISAILNSRYPTIVE